MRKQIIKIIVLLILMLNLSACAGLYKKVEYRIRSVEDGYTISMNALNLTKERIEGKNSIGKINLRVRVIEGNEYVGNIGKTVIEIRTHKTADFINGWYVPVPKNAYEYVKIPEGVIIIKNNGEKIRIDPKEIHYTYEENPETDFNQAQIYLNEKLNGKFTLELGEITIDGKSYNTPRIHMQQYKKVETVSLLGDIINSDPTVSVGPLYRKEGWIEQED